MAGAQRIAGWDLRRTASGRDLSKGRRYVVRVKADAVSSAWRGGIKPGSSGGNAGGGVPEVSVSRAGKVSIKSGAEAFAAARDLGHRTVPVAMTMADARRAHQGGMLQRAGGGHTKHPRQDRFSGGAIAVTVDLTDMNKVARALGGVALELTRQHRAISMAINRGVRELKTKVKRQAQAWTGGKVQKPINDALHTRFATPVTLTGALVVRSGHMVVTSQYFGASWSRSNPGATHAAWNRGQLATGSFMIRGKAPVFTRTTDKRLPLKPLWGPNVAREVIRHRPEVEASVNAVAVRVGAEAARVLAYAVAKAKG